MQLLGKLEIKSKEKIIEFLSSQQTGRISSIDKDGYPQVIPMNFVFNNDVIYMHSHVRGEKLDNIRRNQKVGFEVDKKSLIDLSEELIDLSQRARNKKLKPNELTSGTFTISSLGGIGGKFFTPIINPPEVAILGISQSWWNNIYNEKTKSHSQIGRAHV